MAEVKSHANGEREITMRDPMFTDGTRTDVIIMPSGDAQVFIECGNCCGTASARIMYTDLAELRDFLIEHVKDLP